MRLLLDTHIWIWAIYSPGKLSRQVRRHLESGNNELYLSPVSVWEAQHLERRKKLRFKDGLGKWLDAVLAQVPVLEAPFNFAVAVEASRIHLPQPDIGDLLLAATASAFDLTLVTADAQLLECAGLKTLANA